MVCPWSGGLFVLMFIGIFWTIAIPTVAQTREDCSSFQLPVELDDPDLDVNIVRLSPRETKRGGLLHGSFLDKYSLVFGIPVFAYKDVEAHRVEAVATVLAEFLDNDEDGVPDNEQLVRVLRLYTTVPVITATQAHKRSFFYNVKIANCAPAYQLPGIMAHYEAAEFVGNLGDPVDRTLAFITDFLVQFGYPHTYDPERSIVARKVEEYFSVSVDNGWLNTEILGSNQHTLRQEYQKWLLKAALGVDVAECEYWGIWTLCTPKDLRSNSPALYHTMKQSFERPDGNYHSQALLF